MPTPLKLYFTPGACSLAPPILLPECGTAFTLAKVDSAKHLTASGADFADARTLMPEAGSLARYRVMEWQNSITSEIHQSFTPLFHSDVDASAKNALAAVLSKKLAWLFTLPGWARFVQIDLADLTHIGAFMARVSARPAVQAAIKAEGLIA